MQRAAGCMPASSQAIQQLHSSRCCSCSYTPVWHRPPQRVYLWKQARQRTARQRTARQAARCPVATYPEPETEKERSPLDYPQVSRGYVQLHADCISVTCMPSQANKLVLYAANGLLPCCRSSS